MITETAPKTFGYSSEEDELLLIRTRELAEKARDAATDLRSLLVFRVGGEAFALDTFAVLQVLAGSEVLDVPQTPDYILGIVHIRGEIIAVCDTSILLCGTKLDYTGSYYLLYLGGEGAPLCFAVEQSPESILVDVNGVETPAEDDENRNRDMIEAYVRHGNEYIQILAVDNLLQHRYLTQLLSPSTAE